MGWFKPGSGNCVCQTCEEPFPCEQLDCEDGSKLNVVQVVFVMSFDDAYERWRVISGAFALDPTLDPGKDYWERFTRAGYSGFNGTYTCNIDLNDCTWTNPSKTAEISGDYAYWEDDGSCPDASQAPDGSASINPDNILMEFKDSGGGTASAPVVVNIDVPGRDAFKSVEIGDPCAIRDVTMSRLADSRNCFPAVTEIIGTWEAFE